MTTIKLSKTTLDKLKACKTLAKAKSYEQVLEGILEGLLHSYGLTREGYVAVGDTIEVGGKRIVLVGMNGDLLYGNDGSDVVELHKRGKVLWQASIVRGSL